MKTFLCRLTILFGCWICVTPVFANQPGGGTNGANVTLTDNGTTVTIGNGIVAIVVTKSDASIHTINYTFNNTGSTQTINMLGSHKMFSYKLPQLSAVFGSLGVVLKLVYICKILEICFLDKVGKNLVPKGFLFFRMNAEIENFCPFP